MDKTEAKAEVAESGGKGAKGGPGAAGPVAGAAAGGGDAGGELSVALFNTATPHDAVFKKTFEDPRRALSFLLDYVPQLRGRVRHVELVSSDFIDGGTMREKMCDCILEVVLASGERHLVFAFIEHKSSRDLLAILQIAKYALALLERCAEKDPAYLVRPPRIIPLLLYHGKQPWAMPERLDAMFGAGDDALGLLLRCKCINLSEMPRDALGSDESVQAAFYTMLYVCGALEGEARMEDVAAMLPKDRRFAGMLMAYMQAAGIGYDKIVSAVNAVKPEWGGDIMVNYLKKSWDEGKAEGRAEGKGEDLSRLLQRRFNGDMTPEIQQRIAGASVEELDAWFDRGIDCLSLDAVFEPTPAAPDGASRPH